MTDVHCHLSGGDPHVREFVIGRDFIGIHPWDAATTTDEQLAEIERRLRSDPRLGVGEIGLDRLKASEISPRMREVFERQLDLAFELNRPIVLHGAKAWGQVVVSVKTRFRSSKNHPLCLFHGFSRSGGLIPDIAAMQGYISVGPAILNDHAENYRELVKKIPETCLVVETDRTAENAAKCPAVSAVLEKLAELRDDCDAYDLERITDENADSFRHNFFYDIDKLTV